MDDKLIIEVRVNEYLMRDANRNLPWTAAEIARDAQACREAGAAIVHFHARNDDGSPSHDPAEYAAAVRLIRQTSDMLVHPTLGFVTVAADRIGPAKSLMRDPATRPDFAPVDMGSMNIDTYDRVANTFRSKNKVYANSIETLEFFCRELAAGGVKPALVVWSVPGMRTVDAFMNLGIVESPAFVTFVLSDTYIGAHPATLPGLEAHLMFMPPGKKIHWSVICKGASLLPAAAVSIQRGGHVSIGLGDYAYPELGMPTNADLVHEVAKIAAAAGRGLATPAEARDILGM